MELFLVLLAVRLISSDKLDRAYLPPPGAKYAGGFIDDLQTPLEYPRNDPSYVTDGLTQNPDYADEILESYDIAKTMSKEAYQVEPESHSGYTTVYPQSNFNTFSEIGYKTPEAAGVEYDNKPHLQQNGTTNYFEATGFFGKPGSLPIIAVPESIIQTYQSNAFGIYGGSPMIINSYPKPQVEANALEDHNGYSYDQPSSVLYNSDEKIGSGPQISDLTGTSTTANISSKSKISPAKKLMSSNFSLRNNVRKSYQKRPQAKSDRNADSVNYKNIKTPERYSYSFDTSNGIHMDESATTVNGVKALGSYSYTGDDGKFYSVLYSADEKGFRVRGDHLPTPPPIPAAIKIVIEQAKKDKEAGIFNDGSYDEEKYGHMKYQGPINRYLLKMQDNLELKNRNRVFNRNKTYKTPEFAQAAEQSIERAKIVFNAVTNSNRQFGIKKVSTVEPLRIKTIKNRDNVKNYRQSIKAHHKENSKQKQDFKPNTANFGHRKNKENQSTSFIRNKTVDKLYLIDTTNGSTNRYMDVNSEIDINENPSKTFSIDSGYFYVPPREVFIEGRFQDKSTILKEMSKYDEDTETKTIPIPGFYYVDQRDKINSHEKSTPLMTSYFTSTIESEMNQHTYDSDLYESTIQDVDQSIHHLGTLSTISSSDITTPKPDRNKMSTSFQDLNSMKDIDYQKETMLQDENDIPFTRAELDNTYVSTTPMSLQSNFTSSDTNEHEKSNPTEFYSKPNAQDSEDVGYLKINKPTTFEDIPMTSTTFADNGFQTDTKQNINVDGFGRPILDFELFNMNKPINEHLTTEPVSNDATYSNNFAGLVSETPNEHLISDVSDEAYSFQQDKNTKDNKHTVDRVIGEDFSGPKQPERFDPESGYFY